jgi:hypothetical protein
VNLTYLTNPMESSSLILMEIGVGRLVCIHSSCLSLKGGNSVWGLFDFHNVHFGNTCRLRPTRKQSNTIFHPSGNIVVVFIPLFFPIPNVGHFLFKNALLRHQGNHQESCTTLGSWLEAGRIGQRCRPGDCMVMSLLSLKAMQ